MLFHLGTRWGQVLCSGTGAARPVARRAWECYREVAKSSPYTTGFATCFAKGILAGVFAQKFLERRLDLDGRRALALALFSGVFTGCGYHAIFNVVFARLFGASTGLKVVVTKASLDCTAIFPFMYMPTFYFFDEAIRYGSLTGVLPRWRKEISDAVWEYTKVWPATMICVFSVVPVELRVAFIAGVSFMWLMVLSVFAQEQASESHSNWKLQSPEEE